MKKHRNGLGFLLTVTESQKMQTVDLGNQPRRSEKRKRNTLASEGGARGGVGGSAAARPLKGCRGGGRGGGRGVAHRRSWPAPSRAESAPGGA